MLIYQANSNDQFEHWWSEKVLLSQLTYLFLSFSYKDAVFLSPHKFVGGPGTPGMILPHILLALSQLRRIPLKVRAISAKIIY